MARDTEKLDYAIRSALLDRRPSAEVASLVAEVEAARAAAGERHTASRSLALDPRATAEAVAKARASVSHEEFERDRLTVALSELHARVQELRRLEREETIDAAYATAAAERDELAERIGARCGPLLEELLGLIRAVEASDARLAEVNALRGSRPALASAEALGRDVPDNFFFGGNEHAKRLRTMKVPHARKAGWAWEGRPQ